MNPSPRRTLKGFTLIELMISVAIVAILVAVAYPSYTQYVKRSKRASAQTVLMDIAAKEHSFMLVNRAYTSTITDLTFTTPSEIQGDYTFSVSADMTTSPPSFTVTAKAQGSMSGDQDMTIDQAGTKAPANYWAR